MAIVKDKLVTPTFEKADQNDVEKLSKNVDDDVAKTNHVSNNHENNTVESVPLKETISNEVNEKGDSSS